MPGSAVLSLGLSHFRSHRATRLLLDGRPVVLFGPNGAGKTNILEALSLLSPGRGLRRAPTAEMARQPEALGWKVSAGLRAGASTHEVVTWFTPESVGRGVEIDAAPAAQAALGRVFRLLWLVPAMDRLWIEAAEGRRRFLDRMVLSFEPGHADAVLAYEKVMRERNRLLRDQIRDSGWYGALEAQMAQSGEAICTNRRAALARIDAAMGQAEAAFPAAILSLSGPDGAAMPETASALADALAAGRTRDMAAGRSLTGPHRTDLEAVLAHKGVAAAQCSTGEQKALLIALILANARALAADTGTAPLLLLDEIAAHLDGSRRAALYDAICALDTQAWLTGTGAELFADLAGRAQAFEITDTAGMSTAREESLP